MSVVLLAAVALAAKPVAPQYKGPLDGVDVSQQSAVVIARFEAADRATAERALTTAAKGLGVRVAFVRTDAGPIAGVQLGADGRLTFGRFTALARRLSEEAGVAETWAVISPGARDDSLEQEATFRFEGGAAQEEDRVQYRDAPEYVEHVRRKTSATKFRAARWPDFPLSKLAQKLQLPGRSCLDDPWQLHTLASVRWPIDAGEDLAVTWVDLPGGIATEIQQEALKEKRSPSSMVAAMLAESRAAKVLAKLPTHDMFASYDEGQPDSEKHARRTLQLFLPRAELDAAQDAGAAEAISLSRVVQYAWRRTHPHELH